MLMVVLRGQTMRSCSPSQVWAVWFLSTLRRYPGRGKQGWHCPEETPGPQQWWHLGTQVLVAVSIS